MLQQPAFCYTDIAVQRLQFPLYPLCSLPPVMQTNATSKQPSCICHYQPFTSIIVE